MYIFDYFYTYGAKHVTTDIDAFPKKKRQLIESAMELFFRHGVKRVTVEEIGQNANVSKMTFYKYFENKWGIAKVLLEVLFSEGFRQYDAIMAEPTSYAEKLEQIMALTTGILQTFGDVFLAELMDSSSPLHDFFMKKQTEARHLSVDFFRRAQEAGQLRSDVEMQLLVFMLEHLSELIDHPEFKAIMPNMEDRACELASVFFYGFSKKLSS